VLRVFEGRVAAMRFWIGYFFCAGMNEALVLAWFDGLDAAAPLRYSIFPAFGFPYNDESFSAGFK